MRLGGVGDSTLLDYMIGHRVTVYDVYSDSDLLRAYRKAENKLAVL
jgi:hypothetical protein